jgi:hypothetical protein
VDTGFDPANDTGLRRLMSLSEVTLGLGIPAKSAILVAAGGNGTIAGDGQIAAFRKA